MDKVNNLFKNYSPKQIIERRIFDRVQPIQKASYLQIDNECLDIKLYPQDSQVSLDDSNIQPDPKNNKLDQFEQTITKYKRLNSVDSIINNKQNYDENNDFKDEKLVDDNYNLKLNYLTNA